MTNDISFTQTMYKVNSHLIVPCHIISQDKKQAKIGYWRNTCRGPIYAMATVPLSRLTETTYSSNAAPRDRRLEGEGE